MELGVEVRTEEGLALAEFWGCPFVESSAKVAQNVNTVFAEVVREMNYVQKHRHPPSKCHCCCSIS